MTMNTQVQISTAHKALVLPWRADVAGFLPHGKRFTFNGEDMLAVPHGIDETLVLRNLQIAVPAPILSHYDWPGGRTPFDVQRKTAAMLTMNPRMHCLNGMGTGKTRTALWASDFLRRQGRIKRTLVVAPLSTLTSVWEREIFQVLYGKKALVLFGDRAKRLKLLAMEADYYIVNHDGVAVIADELFKRDDINCFLLDEAAVYRNNSAARTKLMRKLAATRDYVWSFTGSPTPHEPYDAFAQARIVTPWNVSNTNFTQFRDRVMFKVGQFRYIPKPDATETVMEILSPCVRYSLDDVVELPDVSYVHRPVDLSVTAKKVYKALSDHMTAELSFGNVSAVNQGVLLSKLLQVAAGWVYQSDGTNVMVDARNPRLDAVVDIVESTERKVLVFVPFIAAVDGVAKHLKDAGYKFETVYGDVSQTERTRIFNRFRVDPELKGVVAHPQCMAHGLTLTEADTIIWFSPTTSLETFEQANARIRRIGQQHKQQVIMLGGTPVEKKVYRKLEEKQAFLNDLLQLIQNDTDGKE